MVNSDVNTTSKEETGRRTEGRIRMISDSGGLLTADCMLLEVIRTF